MITYINVSLFIKCYDIIFILIVYKKNVTNKFIFFNILNKCNYKNVTKIYNSRSVFLPSAQFCYLGPSHLSILY